MKKLLPEVCTIQYGFPFDSAKFSDSNGMPLIRIRDVVRGYSETYTTEEYKSEYIVHENDLLIGMDGEFNIAKWGKTPALLNQRVCRLAPNDSIDKDYLFYFMPIALKRIEEKTPFVTVKHLSAKELNKIEIPVLSLEEQRKIAETLSKVDKLIAFREQQLAKLDELIKARFVEMFGTFPANPFRWSIGKIQDVVSDVRYGSSRPAVEGGKYPYLRMNNITYSGELDLRDTKRIDIPDSELDKCTVRRGDVLFNRTNSKELVGKTCVYNRDELMVLAGFVIRVRVNERIRSEVLSAFLNMDFSKRMLIGMCKTAIGQANINAKELQNIDLYIPPIELQDQFVTLKNKIDQKKQTVQQSLEKLELLKKALMQEYFG